MSGLLLLLGALQAGPTHVLVVTGLGGEPGYQKAFVEQAGLLVRELGSRHGVESGRITWLAEDPARSPDIGGRSTREAVVAALARLTRDTGPGDRVLLVFIGHGSDAGDPRLNLPGPDLGPGDLAAPLAALTGRTVAVVMASSASGGFVDALQGPGRIVMTATRSGFERNEVLFPAAFVKAFEGAAGDTDKDGRLSLFEAFEFANHEVERIYDADNRLRTEHARVSDEALARRFVFGAATAESADPAVRALLEKKRELEVRIEALRGRRDSLPAAEYQRQLEELLVQLAETNRAIREAGGEGGGPP